ncbi:MAG: hypothetical protein KI785_15820 [Devosiaceae bacterium]|nr:hypothetical protein [Devosiaceae bacterium MH13]
MPDKKTLREAAAGEMAVVASLLKSTIYVATSLVGMLGGLFWLAQPRIDPWLQLPLTVEQGLADVDARVDQGLSDVNARIEVVQRNVQAVNRRVDDLTPPDMIAEYDTARSRILSDECVRGEWCSGVYFVKRTQFGLPFGTPTGEAIVENEGAVPHIVSEIETNRGGGFIRAGDEDYDRVPFRFRVPPDVRPGVGVFYYRLVYVGPNESRRERSHPLVFEIVDP